MAGTKKYQSRSRSKKQRADIEKARKWVIHFNERGEHDTVWHQILKRLEADPQKIEASNKEVTENGS